MKVFRRLQELFGRRRFEADLAEQVRVHLEEAEQDLRGKGMAADEARYLARRRFGNVDVLAEEAREQRFGFWLESLGRDARHGMRVFTRAPGFAVTAVLSLAIGIGAATAMFSVAYGVLLRPLPYPEPDRLVAVWSESRAMGTGNQPSAFGNVADWQAGARTLEGIAAYDGASVVVTSDVPRRVSALFATPSLADLYGIKPQLGRMFSEEDAAGRAAVAVISRAAWQRYYGGAASVLGEVVELDGRRTAIIGVLPADTTDDNTEFWLPHTLSRNWDTARVARGAGSWRVVARLARGSDLAAAQTELSGIASGLERDFPVLNGGLGVRLVPLAEDAIGPNLRNAILLLAGAVGTVLLIACSNVGNLLLARGLTRRGEFALRISLGATRGRLATQLLVETAVICGLAAALGLGIGWGTLDLLRAFAPATIPRLAEVGIDFRMLGFAAGFSLLSAGLFALLPAGLRPDGPPRGERGGTESRGGRQMRRVLVVGEIALAVVLFAGAAMLSRSFIRVLSVDPGFVADNVFVSGLRFSAGRDPGETIPFTSAVLARIGALPGVTAAGFGEEVLLSERGTRLLSAERIGLEDAETVRTQLSSDAITSDYFKALGVRLVDGRFFSAVDAAGAPPVAIVNESLAARLWPEGGAVGRRLRPGGAASTAPWATVVGVVADERRQGLERAPIPQAFYPWAQAPSRAMVLVVRSAGDPAVLSGQVREIVRSVDRTVPWESMAALRAQVEQRLATRRFQTGLLAAFAGTALLLAGVGIFGLMHYAVARRTREIGVRMAVGASAGQILRGVLGEGIGLAGLGIALGLAGALALSRTLAALLFETSPTDTVSLVAAAAVMLGVAALACLLPARRASRIEPLLALRAE